MIHSPIRLLYQAFLLVLVFSQLGFAGTATQNELQVVNNVQVNFNDVSGPGRSASSLTDGTTYLGSLNLYARGSRKDFKYCFNLGGRTTNDKRYDKARFALTSLRGYFSYHHQQLDVGDVFESYSQYSLDSALKGFAYKYDHDVSNLPTVSLVYGMAYPRWENLWKGYDLYAIKREVIGVNITQDINPVLTAGFSLVHSEDSEPVNADDALYNNMIYALTVKYFPIPGLTINGESAISQTSESDGGSARSDTYSGNAQKLEIIGDGFPSRVVLTYERVSPKFNTMTGSAISGQELFNASWRYRYAKNITTNLKFLWFRNHFKDSQLRPHTWQPSVNISVRKLFGRRYAVTSLAYKFEKKKEDGVSTLNQYACLSHSDRYGILENTTSFGFNSFHTSGDTRDQMDYIANTSFNSRLRKGGLIFKPVVSLGTFFYENRLVHQTNRVLQYSAGLGLDIPKRKIYCGITFGRNRLHSFDHDSSDKWFTQFHIYYKPSFLGYLNRSTFSLRAAINDYSFSTASRDFVEKSLSLGIEIPFNI